MCTHRKYRQGDLIPKFVLLGVVFALAPVGGADEAVHQERYDDLRHLVYQLGHDQQRCETLHTDGGITHVMNTALYGPPLL